MTFVNHHLSIRSRKSLAYIINLVQQKQEVELIEAIMRSGYTNIEYFKRSKLPLLLAMSPCIKLAQKSGKLVLRWVCSDNEGVN